MCRRQPRRVEPELLDALPASDPAAARSRRDLRLINALMGNHRWIRTQLARWPGRQGGGICGWELGAGDGSLGASLAAHFGAGSLQLSAVDLAARGPLWPPGWGWHQQDILDAAASGQHAAGVLIANLTLHHFDEQQLAQIGAWAAGADAIIAVEPLRAPFPHLLAYAARFLDINYVTREDIHTSIRAGFRGRELPGHLGLDASSWDVRISTTPLGAYRMFAQRHQAAQP